MQSSCHHQVRSCVDASRLDMLTPVANPIAQPTSLTSCCRPTTRSSPDASHRLRRVSTRSASRSRRKASRPGHPLLVQWAAWSRSPADQSASRRTNESVVTCRGTCRLQLRRSRVRRPPLTPCQTKSVPRRLLQPSLAIALHSPFSAGRQLESHLDTRVRSTGPWNASSVLVAGCSGRICERNLRGPRLICCAGMPITARSCPREREIRARRRVCRGGRVKRSCRTRPGRRARTQRSDSGSGFRRAWRACNL